MRIYSLTKILTLPLVLLIIAILYLEYIANYSTGYWIMLPIVLGVVLLISHGNIDYWYLKKYPIKLDKEVLTLLNQYIPFYNDLNEEDKVKYENRLSQYIEGKKFHFGRY